MRCSDLPYEKRMHYGGGGGSRETRRTVILEQQERGRIGPGCWPLRREHGFQIKFDE